MAPVSSTGVGFHRLWGLLPKGALRVLSVAFVLSGIGAVALMAPYHGDRPNVLVEVIHDNVLINHGDGAFIRVASTGVLRPGETIRTDAHGRAVLTYADGTTVLIVEDSEFSYIVSETSLGEIVVTMLQSTGRMWYRFARVLAPGSRYELRFPVGAAVVRAGSAFDANVEADGTTTIVTSAGVVEVVAAGVTVPIGSGRQTVVHQGTPPSTPSPAQPEPAPSSSPSAAPTASNTPTPSSPPTSQPTPAPSIVPNPTLPPTPSLLPTATPSPSPTPTPTPTLTPIVPLPSLLPTPTPSPSPTPTPSSTPTPSHLPVPTPPLPTAPLPLPSLP